MSVVDREFQISIPSRPESISEVEGFVEQIKEELEIGDELFGNVLISLTEAVNNGIEHGNRFDLIKEVVVSCKMTDNLLIFRVEDEGEGFEFDDLPDPTDPSNLEKATGRGVFLMRQLSDNLSYTLEDGRFIAEMRFKL